MTRQQLDLMFLRTLAPLTTGVTDHKLYAEAFFDVKLTRISVLMVRRNLGRGCVGPPMAVLPYLARVSRPGSTAGGHNGVAPISLLNDTVVIRVVAAWPGAPVAVPGQHPFM